MLHSGSHRDPTTGMLHLAELTTEELRDLDKTRAVAILPVGATEAHGPHLPLATDVIIAQAMARAGATLLDGEGVSCVIAPTVAYTAAAYAAGFAGTLSVRPETASAVYEDVIDGLGRAGFRVVAIANAHLDPGHIGSIRSAIDRVNARSGVRVAFPDVTRKPWALRLGEEFRSGACHAGRYEGSVVLAERPELVRDELRRSLPANPASLSVAIREGRTTFEQAGGPRAYFGDPAAASPEEGRATIAALGAILAEATLAVL